MTARKTSSEPSESWDDFWAEVHGGRRTTVIHGVEVAIPNDVPVGFGDRFNALSDSSSEEDIAELIGMLFGDKTAEKWLAPPKIGTRQLMTVLLWGMAQAGGEDLSFAEAYERVKKQDSEGKAPNRAARRAAQKPRSAAGGGPSKRTSSASTTSARKTSRT